MNTPANPPAWQRLPLLVPAMLALTAGVWGGLVRVGAPVMLPVDHAGWLTHHGALMVSGFLGTLIGMERAVGSGARAAYVAPSLWFAAVTFFIAWRHRAFFTALMAVAALAWVVGNLLLLLGRPVAKWRGGGRRSSVGRSWPSASNLADCSGCRDLRDPCWWARWDSN